MIITRAILDTIKPLDKSLKDDRVNMYIIEAERIDVSEVLGDVMYKELIDGLSNSPIVQKWTDLVDGCNYVYNAENYIFYGLKYAIAYFAYARFLQSQQINVTTHGIVRKTFENSDVLDSKTLKIEIDKCQEIGSAYLRKTTDFLDRNKTIYSNWNTKQQYKQGSQIITAI